MYILVVENKYGQQLELTNNNAYEITEIDGLDPPEGVINTTRNANADGSVYNSAYIDNRTIIITLAINGPAEMNRINLYKYFKTKFPVTLYYQNDSRNVYINGYVQSMEISFFDKKQIAQITILCPDPLFNGASNYIVNFSSVENLFKFPFSIQKAGIPFSEILVEQEHNIINNGDMETGVTFVIHALGPIINPIIYNTETNEFFGVTLTMVKGDEIKINTKKKQKSVTLTSNGITTKLIGKLKQGSTWFQLNPGDNVFITSAEEYAENIQAYCVITDQFEGV